MTKLVLDTNVFVSEIFWSGPPAKILNAWHEKKIKEARFWIDTKPKSYEEIKNQTIYINGVKKNGMIYSILFD